MIATLALLLAAQAAPDVRNDPWHGVPEGSWIVLVKKTTLGAETKTQRLKRVLARMEAGAPELEESEEVNGEYQARASRIRHVPGLELEKAIGKETAAADEKYEVDGRALAARKRTIEASERDAKLRIVRWESEEASLPYRELPTNGPDHAMGPKVLRLDYLMERGDQKESSSMAVKTLKESLSIGSRTVTCVVEEGGGEIARGPQKIRATWKRWLSNEVPGRLVKSERKVTRDGKTTTLAEEVESFELKK